MKAHDVIRKDVFFNTRDGTELGGWLYPSVGAIESCPCVVMSHGLTAQIDFGLAPFAESLQAAGIAVLVFDHRGWGRSGGEPRLESNPFLQMQDTRDAITYATTLPGINERKIGLWGTSYSGGTGIMVAAIDRRIKSVVAVCPFVSGSGIVRRQMGDQNFAAHQEAMGKARKTEMVDATIQYRQHTSIQETIDFFKEVDQAGRWENKITVRSYDMMMEFEPGDYVHRVSPTPLLMIVPTKDTRVPTDLQLDIYQRALEPKRLIFIEGGHYDPYVRQLGAVSVATRDWFVSTLISDSSAPGAS
jgi:uncharacterized protein